MLLGILLISILLQEAILLREVWAWATMSLYSYSVWKIRANKTCFSVNCEIGVHIVYRFVLFSREYSIFEATLDKVVILINKKMDGYISALISILIKLNILKLLNKYLK